MARPLVLIGDELFLDGERVGTLCLPGGSTRDLLEAVLREIDLDVSARQRDDVFYAGYDTGYAAAQEKKEPWGGTKDSTAATTRDSTAATSRDTTYASKRRSRC